MKRAGHVHSFFYFNPELRFGTHYLQRQLHQFLITNSIQAYLVCSPFEFHNYRMLKKRWFGSIKVGMILYDLIPLIYPHVYLSDPTLFSIYHRVLDFVRRCDFILAISESTKRDAIHLLGINPSKIKVIGGGVEPQFKAIPSINRAELCGRYKITKPYVMYSGAIEFRKNIDRILQAFHRANGQMGKKYQLVMVGVSNEAEKQHLLQLAMKFGVSQDLVVTGYVSNEELINLYNCAEVFLFPSFYEGLGFPVMEAMACGVPVITSNTSSLGEIVGNSAYIVNPHNVDEITAGLVQILKNLSLREDLKNKGLKQVAQFQWSTVAQKALNGILL